MSRHHCTVNLLSGYALDSSSWPVKAESACKNCQGCDSSVGDQGIAGDGIAVRTAEAGQRVTLTWACPGCGQTVVEDTTPLGAMIDAQALDQDRLCWRCRK